MTSTKVRRRARSGGHHVPASRHEHRPSLDESVRALLPRVRALASETEAGRAVPAELVQELVQAGLFRMTLPRALGGLELDPVTVGKVIEDLSGADGSTGWVVMLSSQISGFAGFVPEPVARQIFEGTDAIIAGATRPSGKAVPVEGGYRVSGRWPFASGSSHATWFIGGCLVMENGQPRLGADGKPLVLQVPLPRDVCVIHDNWRTLGLRGTASHDFSVEDVFVPDERTFSFAAMQPWHPWAMYRCPPLGPTWHGSHALGIARAALADVLALARGKVAYGSQNTQREHPRVQGQVAEAQALVESARAYLHGTVAAVWAGLTAGHEATPEQRAELRLAASNAVRSSVQAMELVQAVAGTTAVFQQGALERQFRDLRTAATHTIIGPLAVEASGRVLLGLEAGLPFF